MPVKISYDPAKNARNIAERGLSFERVVAFEFETAVIVDDTRRDYGETRHRATGWMNGRLFVLVFVHAKDCLRVISFRKANLREVQRYEQSQS